MGMMLTTEQVAMKLGVTKGVVAKLARTGQLASANVPKEGAKRVEWKFDPAVVKAFKQTYVPKRHGGGRRRKAALATLADGPGFIRQHLGLLVEGQAHLKDQLNDLDARLTAVEQKLDDLIKMWS